MSICLSQRATCHLLDQWPIYMSCPTACMHAHYFATLVKLKRDGHACVHGSMLIRSLALDSKKPSCRKDQVSWPFVPRPQVCQNNIWNDHALSFHVWHWRMSPCTKRMDRREHNRGILLYQFLCLQFKEQRAWKLSLINLLRFLSCKLHQNQVE